jgi:hypothetical protein
VLEQCVPCVESVSKLSGDSECAETALTCRIIVQHTAYNHFLFMKQNDRKFDFAAQHTHLSGMANNGYTKMFPRTNLALQDGENGKPTVDEVREKLANDDFIQSRFNASPRREICPPVLKCLAITSIKFI